MVIYKLTNVVRNRSYIGKTVATVNRRWSEHKSYAKHNRFPNCYLHKAIRKYGPESFVVEQLAQFDDEETLAFAEQLFIAEFGTLAPNGYNLTQGGEGSTGYKHSDATRAKLKRAWTPERKTATSKRHRGKTITPYIRQMYHPTGILSS